MKIKLFSLITFLSIAGCADKHNTNNFSINEDNFSICQTSNNLALLKEKGKNLNEEMYLKQNINDTIIYSKLIPTEMKMLGYGYDIKSANNDLIGKLNITIASNSNKKNDIYIITKDTKGSCRFSDKNKTKDTSQEVIFGEWQDIEVNGILFIVRQVYDQNTQNTAYIAGKKENFISAPKNYNLYGLIRKEDGDYQINDNLTLEELKIHLQRKI